MAPEHASWRRPRRCQQSRRPGPGGQAAAAGPGLTAMNRGRGRTGYGSLGAGRAGS